MAAFSFRQCAWVRRCLVALGIAGFAVSAAAATEAPIKNSVPGVPAAPPTMLTTWPWASLSSGHSSRVIRTQPKNLGAPCRAPLGPYDLRRLWHKGRPAGLRDRTLFVAPPNFVTDLSGDHSVANVKVVQQSHFHLGADRERTILETIS